MSTLLLKPLLFFTVFTVIISANSINTNSSHFGDNNSVPLPTVVKYVTPYGTGNHSDSSWTNAYSIQDLKHRLASNTTFYFADSTFLVDSIVVNNFTNISFIGKGKDKTILEGIDVGNVESIINWSIKCFDILNSSNTTIKDLQIRRFRRWGIRVGSTSNNFLGHNLYIDSCGWTAETGEVMLSPCAVKLFGDFGHLGQSQIMQSGWDGMQVAGYGVLLDSSTIYWTGRDDPGAIHQGDGIHMFKNPNVSYIIDGVQIGKAGRLIGKNCVINTVEAKKSGIEAGFIDPSVEKPLVQVYNSRITGGKGIGITQSADPLYGGFYSTIENCTIEALDPLRRPLRIGFYDTGTPGVINNNILICHPGFNPLLCPVGEYDTDPNAVNYGLNTWKIGDRMAGSILCRS
ncbi:MAG: hypothetical protein IPH11_09850 [Ignavibacteriales bacterium]|nr:hypothetical protein [Ignavibacteriales bacterium]